MTKIIKLLLITGFLVLCTRAEAQVAGWITNSDPSGSTESASLYNQINFGVGVLDVRIKAGSADPSSAATLGKIGDLYISTNGTTYQKQDAGVTTNWTSLGGAAPSVDVVSTTVEFFETQGNGFSVLEGIYHNGTIWTEAKADSGSTLASHVVIEATGTDFRAAKSGRFPIANGLVAGQYYFLSATVAGGSSTSEPPLYSNPLFKIEDANTVNIDVVRPSRSIDFASGSLRYEFLVGDSNDVTNGAADFDSVQTAINFATAGNKITLLPRTFTENVTINKSVLVEGYGQSSVISGSVDFTITSGDESTLRDLKVAGDITINSDATRIQDIDQRTGDTINNLGTDNIVRDVIVK